MHAETEKLNMLRVYSPCHNRCSHFVVVTWIYFLWQSNIYLSTLRQRHFIHLTTAHMVSLYSGRVFICLAIVELCAIFNSSILSFHDRNVYLYPIFKLCCNKWLKASVCSVTSCTVTLVLCWKQEESEITTLYLVLCCREEKESNFSSLIEDRGCHPLRYR